MSFIGSCPHCGSEISHERLATGFAICECGWMDPAPAEKARNDADKRTIIAMVGTAVFAVAFYAHLVTWGTYAAAIPFVKLQQVTGTLSKAGYEELAGACIKLARYSCAKTAYLDLFNSKREVSGLANLAKLQVRLGELDASAQTYSTYFKVGGNDGDAALHFAKLLEERGQTEDAFRYYELSIQARPETLPVQATTAIVRLLIKQGRYDEALERVTAFHESAQNAKGFLNTELAQLEQYFSKNGKKVASKM